MPAPIPLTEESGFEPTNINNRAVCTVGAISRRRKKRVATAAAMGRNTITHWLKLSFEQLMSSAYR